LERVPPFSRVERERLEEVGLWLMKLRRMCFEKVRKRFEKIS